MTGLTPRRKDAKGFTALSIFGHSRASRELAHATSPYQKSILGVSASLRETGLRVLPLCLFVLLLLLVRVAHAGEKVFVQYAPSPPTSLDPAKTNRIHDDRVIWLLYDALTQVSADGSRMLPALAERWEKSADGLTYTFSLRKNVRFHDGTLLDADAVKASYERQYLRASPFYSAAPPNVYERTLGGLVKDIRALGPHSVAITLAYPRPREFSVVKIVSLRALRDRQHDLARSPAGTGPFRLERWDAGTVALVPFPRSWHARPKIEGVRFVALGTEAEAVERLAAGEFHLVLNVPPDFFEQLQQDPGVDLLKFGGLNTMILGMLLDRPALRDRRLREAVVRAVHRDRIATVLGRGAMRPASGPLPPGCAGFDRDTAQPSHDPERARSLVRELPGEPVRLRLLYFSPLELWTELVHAIQGDLERAGIGIELVPAKSWQDFHEQRRKGAHDLHLFQWSVSTPEPERFLYPLFHSQSQDNFGRFRHAGVDALLEEARRPMDDADRLERYREVSRIVAGEVPALFLVHRIGMAGVSSRIHGLALNLYGLPQDKLATVEMRAK
jgi:peptide/nickel transport system substrate-binding protein